MSFIKGYFFPITHKKSELLIILLGNNGVIIDISQLIKKYTYPEPVYQFQAMVILVNNNELIF